MEPQQGLRQAPEAVTMMVYWLPCIVCFCLLFFTWLVVGLVSCIFFFGMNGTDESNSRGKHRLEKAKVRIGSLRSRICEFARECGRTTGRFCRTTGNVA